MQFTRRRVTDAGLLVLVNAMWAAQYPAYKTATSAAGPVALGLWTFLIAALVMAPFYFWERRQSTRHAPRFEWWHFLLLAALGLIPGSAVLAWGTELSAVLLKERITAAMIGGGLLTLAGTILITTAHTEGLEEGK
jgi:drug/metabolite transporter (DMT)-like permease